MNKEDEGSALRQKNKNSLLFAASVPQRKRVLPEHSITQESEKSPVKQVSAIDKMKQSKYREGFKIITDSKIDSQRITENNGQEDGMRMIRSPQEIKPSFRSNAPMSPNLYS